MILKLAIVLLAVGYASSQGLDLKPYNVTAAALFYVSDANKDGILTLSEVDSNFRSYDRDDDGRISRYEYTSHVDANSPQLHAFSHGLYDIYDVDSDDFLDAHDYESFFKLMDSDENDVVTQHEYVRYWIVLLETLEHLHGGGRKRANL
ncbi:unnamed protein product [Candidula unifasciata]|uniref:EF-hand domain-containing protein n=1 Tax=Candidula unifasciata TaxID=100452 RepID=A0A8S4A7P6_9EUPU|nr:unnamed protein product [Candidula unifasciata]